MGGLGNCNSWRHENIVLLTAKEHYMCHLLLHSIYPQDKKLLYALHRMIFSKCSNKKEDLRLSARLYDYFRKEHSKAISGTGNPMYGANHKESSKLKMSQSKKGKPNHKMLGDLNPSKRPEVREKMRLAKINLGENHYSKRKDVIDKMVATHKVIRAKKKELGIPAYKTLECPHCNKQGSANNMSRYHFDNCKKLTSIDRHKGPNFKKVQCPYCNKTGASNGMTRYHFDNCKNKNK